MATFIELHHKCWTPAMLYNSETWMTSNKDIDRLEQLQLNTLRRFLKVPTSTPKIAIYSELGIQPIHFTIHQMKLKYLWKLLNSTTNTRQILTTQLLLHEKNS